MMRRLGIVLLAAALATFQMTSPARAWDPNRETRTRETPTVEPIVDPAPYVAPPPGIYYVTDTYVADVVTTSGPLTTYSTTTVHESTGSYARVLDVVATGARSAYDGAAFNGRRALSDGRAIAGTYYQNYVEIDGRFVPVSVVFFQDDAEWQRLSAPTPPPTPTLVPTTTPTVMTTARPPLTTPPPTICCAPTRPSLAPIPTPTRLPLPPIRGSLSLVPAGAPLSRIEVLRGRTVTFWPRAFIDDREIAIASWSVISGETGDAVTMSGRGGMPFVTSWSRLAPPGMAYELVFRIVVETTEGPRAVNASVTVVVRSPALEPLA